MKRRFINPEIIRIETNLTANIAASEKIEITPSGAFLLSHMGLGCKTNYSAHGDIFVNDPFSAEEALYIMNNCALLPMSYSQVMSLTQR